MLQTVVHEALRTGCIKEIGMQRESNRKYSSLVEETVLARHIRFTTEHFSQLQNSILTMKQAARCASGNEHGKFSMLENMLKNFATQTRWWSLKKVLCLAKKKKKKV